MLHQPPHPFHHRSVRRTQRDTFHIPDFQVVDHRRQKRPPAVPTFQNRNRRMVPPLPQINSQIKHASLSSAETGLQTVFTPQWIPHRRGMWLREGPRINPPVRDNANEINEIRNKEKYFTRL